MSSQEKPPISSKEVVISVSLAKDSDSDCSPSKVPSNQSSPLIIRGAAELLRLTRGEEERSCIGGYWPLRCVMWCYLQSPSLLSVPLSSGCWRAASSLRRSKAKEPSTSGGCLMMEVGFHGPLLFQTCRHHQSEIFFNPVCVCNCRPDAAHSLPAHQQRQVGRLSDPCLHWWQDQPDRSRPSSVSWSSGDVAHRWTQGLRISSAFLLCTCFVRHTRMATLLSRFRIDFSDIIVLGDINTKPKKHK